MNLFEKSMLVTRLKAASPPEMREVFQVVIANLTETQLIEAEKMITNERIGRQRRMAPWLNAH